MKDIDSDKTVVEISKNKEIIKEKKSHPILGSFLVIILFLIGGIYWYASSLGMKGIVTKEYRVESEILTSNFNGIKIVHFDSLLYGSSVDKNDITKIINKINEYKPDIVLFTGDLISKDEKLTEEEKEFLITSLSNIEYNLGKYAIKGDYDYNLYSYEEIMESGGFKVLKNSYEKVFYKDSNYMYIVGLDSYIKGNIDMETAFEFYDDADRRYTIVMVHEGNVITKLNNSDYETDLIVGGHSLNGSVVLPFIGAVFLDSNSEYYKPYYKKGITEIYISSGIGTKKYKYRFLNKPSFNLYRLKSNQ